MAVLLEARGISKAFGGVQALQEADFACSAGEVHALIGENGAGKSTMVKILSGVFRPDSGSVRFREKEVRFHSPHDAAQAGISAVFQELSLLPELSVAQNIYLGREPRRFLGLLDWRQMSKDAAELLADLHMQHISPDALVGHLPLAQQQQVEIAKVLARDPQVVILDEATSALGALEVDNLFGLVRRMRAQGKTIIFISHRMDELTTIADNATVFRSSRHVATFPMGSKDHDEIVSLMVGRDVEHAFPRRAQPVGDEVVLAVRGLSLADELQDVSFELRTGEILGLAGLQGQGQGSLLEALYGAVRPDRGEVCLQGRKVAAVSPEAAIRAGISLVPEDRKQAGLMLPLSIRENLSLSTLNRRLVAGLVDVRAELQAVAETCRRLQVKAPSFEEPVSNLSGGNQQKVVIGKSLLTEAPVLLLADPTRGIDVGTKHEVYLLMRELAAQRVSILFLSTELPELVHLCDRVLVMFEGRIVRTLSGAELTEEAIVSAAVGGGAQMEVSQIG